MSWGTFDDYRDSSLNTGGREQLSINRFLSCDNPDHGEIYKQNMRIKKLEVIKKLICLSRRQWMIERPLAPS